MGAVGAKNGPAIGVITGMVSEVRALGRWASDPRVTVAVSGASPDQAEAAAREMARTGVGVLVSWGLAGGLAPALSPGDLIYPSIVLGPGGSQTVVGDSNTGVLLGVDRVITSPQDKAQLHAETGAIAVDMESHRLALVARETGVNLRVIRAISDPAHRALPSAAVSALGPDGRPQIRRVVGSLLRQPGQLPGLIHAARDSARALKALAVAADATLCELTAAL